MKQHTPTRASRLAGKIKKILEHGIRVDPDTMHYIRSTFPEPVMKDLAHLVHDDSNCERDSLLELIFYPDESIQVQLEDLLNECNFNKGDVNRVEKILGSKAVRARLDFFELNQRVSLNIPADVIRLFISRLNITDHPDPEILESIRRFTPDGLKCPILVKLRNGYKKRSPRKTAFISEFIEKMQPHWKNQAKSFDFVLHFLDEQADFPNIYQALVKKKHELHRHLSQVIKSEHWLKTENMETLMLKGRVIPVLSRAELMNTISRIDFICLTVFNKTEPIAPDPVPENQVKILDNPDIKTIMRTLG